VAADVHFGRHIPGHYLDSVRLLQDIHQKGRAGEGLTWKMTDRMSSELAVTALFPGGDNLLENKLDRLDS
jgi:hypothetical protein